MITSLQGYFTRKNGDKELEWPVVQKNGENEHREGKEMIDKAIAFFFYGKWSRS
jgi:hypothetical protein